MGLGVCTASAGTAFSVAGQGTRKLTSNVTSTCLVTDQGQDHRHNVIRRGQLQVRHLSDKPERCGHRR